MAITSIFHREGVGTVTFNQLVLRYPDVRYEISGGKKRLARITVEYSIAGPPEAIMGFMEELDKEWPFSQQRCKGTPDRSGVVIEVDYIIRPEEVEIFVKSVPYRGRKIVLVS